MPFCSSERERNKIRDLLHAIRDDEEHGYSSDIRVEYVISEMGTDSSVKVLRA